MCPAPAIHPFQPDEAAAIRLLAAGLRRWFSPPDLRAIDDLLGDDPGGWVAQHPTGALIGFLLTAPTPDPAVREIAWMAVEEAHHGQGIGTALLEAAIRQAAADGLRALEVSTVAASAGYAPYEATRAFYHRRGFVDLRIDPDYYWPGGDRLVLHRPIDG